MHYQKNCLGTKIEKFFCVFPSLFHNKIFFLSLEKNWRCGSFFFLKIKFSVFVELCMNLCILLLFWLCLSSHLCFLGENLNSNFWWLSCSIEANTKYCVYLRNSLFVEERLNWKVFVLFFVCYQIQVENEVSRRCCDVLCVKLSNFFELCILDIRLYWESNKGLWG